MEMYGIRFSNRTKTRGIDAEDPARANTEFAAFAALCASLGVASVIKGVEYSSNSCCYALDVDPVLERTTIGDAIEWAASRTLSQFELFGIALHRLKHESQDPL